MTYFLIKFMELQILIGFAKTGFSKPGQVLRLGQKYLFNRMHHFYQLVAFSET